MDEKHLKELWNNEEANLTSEKINSSLKMLLYRINAFDHEKAIQIKRHKHIRLLYSAACIIIIPLLLCTILYMINPYPKDKYITNLEYFAPVGESLEIVLPDSTHVTLNSGSVLITPEKYITDERTVSLIGEAYFKVAKDRSKPFKVKTQLMTIEALGTEFAVMSYPQSSHTKTTLVEGSLRLSVLGQQDKIRPIILRPNQQSDYNSSMAEISVSDVDISAYTSWVDKNLIFDNTPFEDVITRLEIQSGKTIGYDRKIARYRISAKFISHEPLDEILKLLCQITYSKYTILDENTYNIK